MAAAVATAAAALLLAPATGTVPRDAASSSPPRTHASDAAHPSPKALALSTANATVATAAVATAAAAAAAAGATSPRTSTVARAAQRRSSQTASTVSPGASLMTTAACSEEVDGGRERRPREVGCCPVSARRARRPCAVESNIAAASSELMSFSVSMWPSLRLLCSDCLFPTICMFSLDTLVGHKTILRKCCETFDSSSPRSSQ